VKLIRRLDDEQHPPHGTISASAATRCSSYHQMFFFWTATLEDVQTSVQLSCQQLYGCPVLL
jgi:hypothetical protein